MQYRWPYRIVWNFRGGPTFMDGQCLPFHGYNFLWCTHSCPLCTVQSNFFVGLISTVKRSSMKRENWTLEIFYAAIIIIIIFYITSCWILKKIKKGEGSGRAWIQGKTTTYSEVVSEQLHDESAVLVGVLLKSVQLSNGLVKCLKKQKKTKCVW